MPDCLSLSVPSPPPVDRPGLGTSGFSHSVVGLTSPEGVLFCIFSYVVVLRSRTSGLWD